MSEIRKELEHFARKLNIGRDTPANQDDREPEASDAAAAEKAAEIIDEYLTAPAGYDGEYAASFAGLPAEWRKYLHLREREIARGFKELRDRTDAYGWLEDAYAARVGELQNYGIKSSKEWLDNMIKVDSLLSRSPVDAIKMLADIYHVGTNRPAGGRRAETAAGILAGRIIQKQVDDFAGELTVDGKPKHPFFQDVVKDMYDLLQKGVVSSLDDAYEAAVWFNAKTRDKLIAQRSQEALELKSKDALKSKEAAFAPKGKADFDTKDLSLREELEMRFAALNGEL